MWLIRKPIARNLRTEGAEAEWGSGETTVFSDYYNSYREWYELCMDAHGK